METALCDFCGAALESPLLAAASAPGANDDGLRMCKECRASVEENQRERLEDKDGRFGAKPWQLRILQIVMAILALLVLLAFLNELSIGR
jgi:hypothetical protein